MAGNTGTRIFFFASVTLAACWYFLSFIYEKKLGNTVNESKKPAAGRLHIKWTTVLVEPFRDSKNGLRVFSSKKPTAEAFAVPF